MRKASNAIKERKAFRGFLCEWLSRRGDRKRGIIMAIPYNHKEVEQKWQTVWDDERAFATSNDYSKPKPEGFASA